MKEARNLPSSFIFLFFLLALQLSLRDKLYFEHIKIF